jgi:acetolactate synthase-1/2/3 large subunit
MSEITGGELLLKCLKKEGLKRIFALPDFAFNTLIAKTSEYGVRWIAPRHEAAAVHMAEAVFKTTGEIPVTMAAAGPGMANLVSGIINAREEGVPVIAITAQRRSGVIYPAKPGTYQGIDQSDVFKPITKWSAVVHQWERIPELIQWAYREATTGRPGPVHVDIPDSILEAFGDDSKVKILDPHRYRAAAPEPSQQQIEEAAALLASAKNPLLFGGTGVLNAEAWGEFEALARLLNCPATTSMATRTILPDGHPNYIFGYGKGALTARVEADVVLAVGTRLGELDLPFDKYWGDIDKQKIVQIDVDPRNIGLHRPIHRGIIGDAKVSLSMLIDCLKAKKVKPSDGKHLRQYKDMEEEWRQEQSAQIAAYTGNKIHPVHSVRTAREVFGVNAINVGDGGNTSLYNALFTDFAVPRTSLGIFEFGHLGIGIPYAVGAKIANPDKEVYVITGDGAAGFNFMEMETALREKAKITVIVHAEEAWCMEEITQLMATGDPSKVVGCAQSPVRWDKVAEGIGCFGQYVDTIDDLKGSLERARDQALPAVVCVKTDKQANLIPPEFQLFMEVYEGVPEE